MAITTFTGDLSAFFAAGTSLQARPASNWAAHKRPPEAGTTPVGSATATATSSSAGVLSLTGLTDSTEYYVSDSAGTRYVRITTFPERQELTTADLTAEQDARAAADALLVPLAQRNAANGYPGLNPNSKIPWALLSGSPINITDFAYGAKGDGKKITDAAITTGTATLTSASAAFTTSDVGKTVWVAGAGAAGAVLATTILSRTNSTTVVLSANAGTTVSAAVAVYGTDDTAAIQAALDAQGGLVGAPPVYVPQANGFLYSNLTLKPNTRFVGAGVRNALVIRIPGSTGVGITDNGNAAGIHLQDLRIDNNYCAGTALKLGYGATKWESNARISWVRFSHAGPGEWMIESKANVLHVEKVAMDVSDKATAKGWKMEGGAYSGGPVKITLCRGTNVSFAATSVSSMEVHCELDATFDDTAPVIDVSTADMFIRARCTILSGATVTDLIKMPSGFDKNSIELILSVSGGTLTNAINDAHLGRVITGAQVGNESVAYSQTWRADRRGKGVINHGSTAGTARPPGYYSVEWYGSVQPTNMVAGDTWIDTS